MELIFTWDAKKAKAKRQKHKVSFEEAKTLFNDPLLLTFLDEEHSVKEERFISIGSSSRGRILLVVHTEQKEDENSLIIRLISYRKATALERRTYEEGEN